MHKFVRNLLTEWRKLNLPFRDETFVVAVSGGADSVSLALALADLKRRRKLDLRFVVAHFDHGLRGPESALEAKFVAALSAESGFEFALEKGAISKRGNLEQNARRARYEFLIRSAQNLDAYGILTAHTRNDQAETFLMNLIRGSGLDGLSGMKPVITNFKSENADPRSEIRNPKSETALVRPLLGWTTRAATEDFCRFKRVPYRADTMNDDLRFTRVKIRKTLLPALREFNPKIVETLAKTAELLRIENEGSGESAAPAGEELSLADLKKLPRSVLYRVLRAWLGKHRGDRRRLEAAHLEALERLMTSRKSGRAVELPGGDRVLKSGGKLSFRRKNIENIGHSA